MRLLNVLLAYKVVHFVRVKNQIQFKSFSGMTLTIPERLVEILPKIEEA